MSHFCSTRFPILSGKKNFQRFYLTFGKIFGKKWQNRHFGPSTLLQGSIWSLNFQKDQFDPSILFLGQICPYTDVMLHNTIRLMLKSHRYP